MNFSFERTDSTTSPLVAGTGSGVFFSSTKYSIQAEVPIANWAASAALSTTETLFVTARMRASGDPASATGGNPIIFPTRDYDNFSAYSVSTGLYTAPKSGYYQLKGFLISPTSATTIAGYVNSTSTVNMANTDSNGEAAFIGTVFANKGDTISVRPTSNLDVASGSFFYIEELPDFSIFSTYGTFELKTATSDTKTPGASAQYQQLTNNSITLSPGTWRISATVNFGNNGGNPAYSDIAVGLYGANGSDGGSAPAALTTVSGLTILSATPLGFLHRSTPISNNTVVSTQPIIVRCTSSCTFYPVTFCQMTTAASARITTYANAERLQ